MTPEERNELEKTLNTYRRQKAKTESSIEAYKALIEELQSQLEQYPENKEIMQELNFTSEMLRKVQNNYELIRLRIIGIEWLLE
jgi:chromosome segregation ATPase